MAETSARSSPEPAGASARRATRGEGTTRAREDPVGIVALERDDGERCLLARARRRGAATGGDAWMYAEIRVCGATGALRAVGDATGRDGTGGLEEALARARASGFERELARGACALGYGVYGDVAVLLIARSTRVAATLPTGDEVTQVRESAWVRLALRNACAGLNREERVNLQSLCEFSCDGTHFFCHTFDVSRPFAHGRAMADGEGADREWVWNAALSAPLRATGVPGVCPTLVQGLVEHRELRDANGKLFNLCIFGKRSSLHPGTRYIARGLNEIGAPGNEVEMEQLVWCEVDRAKTPDFAATNGKKEEESSASSGGTIVSTEGKVFSWASYVWRRGSVPISWMQEIKQAYGEAEIQVAKDNPYKGTGTYFARMMNAYRSNTGPSHESFPITCVNLLRCAPGKPEFLLSEHFHEAIRGVKQRAGLGEVSVLNFDWHANCKALGEAKTVEGLWMALRQQLVDGSVYTGSAVVDKDGAEKAVNGWQRGLLRYNCADSLDRTNLAGFFVAAQVLTEQCAVLGLSVFNASANAGLAYASAAQPNEGRITRTSSGTVLPPGWESRTDTTSGRTFYIDHNTRTTSWTLPAEYAAAAEAVESSPNKNTSCETSPTGSPLLTRLNSGQKMCQLGSAEWLSELMKNPDKNQVESESFKWLGSTVDEFRAAMLPQCLNAMVEIFLANGDFHAQMYTSTRASHSATIHLLDANPATAAAVRFKSTPTTASSTVSNAALGIQRRFHNMVSDGAKQQQFEMFLGLNSAKHFPSVVGTPGRVLTRAGASAVREQPKCIKPGLENELIDVIRSSRGALYAATAPLWITPKGEHEFSITFDVLSSVGEPGYLLLRSPASVSEFVAPSHIDVVVNQGGQRDSVTSFALPRVPPGTPLGFSLRDALSASNGGVRRFDQDALDSSDGSAYAVMIRARNHAGEDESKKDLFLAVGHFELLSERYAVAVDDSSVVTTRGPASTGEKPPIPREAPASIGNTAVPSTTASEDDYVAALKALDPGEPSLSSLLDLEAIRMRAHMSVVKRDALIMGLGKRPSDLDPTERLRLWLARTDLTDLENEKAEKRATASTPISAMSGLRGLSLSSLTESIMGPMIRPNSATLSHVSNALGSHQAVAQTANAVAPVRSLEDQKCADRVDELKQLSSKLADLSGRNQPFKGRHVIECSGEVLEAETRAESSNACAKLLADANVRAALDTMPSIRREYMRTTFEHSALNGALLHVGVPSSVVIGFKLAVPDATQGYSPSIIRVTAVCDAEAGELVHVEDYVIPATKPRSTLHYELGQTFTQRQPKSLLFHLYTAPGRSWSLPGRVSLYVHALDPPARSVAV